jgi:hypothetical protein
MDAALRQYLSEYPDLEIICGYDPNDERYQGADQLAYEWASAHGVPRQAFPARWTTYRRAAGPIRNGQMLAEGEPRWVIAFPGGRGTADMIRRARAAGYIVGRYGPHSAWPDDGDAKLSPEPAPDDSKLGHKTMDFP